MQHSKIYHGGAAGNRGGGGGFGSACWHGSTTIPWNVLIQPDMSSNDIFKINVDSSLTCQISNPLNSHDGQTMTLILVNDGGGAGLVTFDPLVFTTIDDEFSHTLSPRINPAAYGVTILTFVNLAAVGSDSWTLVDNVPFYIPVEMIPRYFYGVTGDGTTNDAAAINACLAAEDKCYLLPGTYMIGSTIFLDGEKILTGAKSAVLKKSTSGFPAVTISSNYNKLSDIRIDCNSYDDGIEISGIGGKNTIDNIVLTNTNGSTSIAIYISGGASSEGGNIITNNHLDGIGGRGVVVNNIGNLIAGNFIENTEYEAIELLNSGIENRIVDNIISTTCQTGGDGAICLEGINNRCNIIGNIIETCGADGIICTGNGGDVYCNSIVSNHISSVTGYCIYLATGAVGSGLRHVISGNCLGTATVGSLRFDAGCNNNEARYNQYNGVAVSDAGTGNTY